jgi:AcrR family transcriptional regulator
MSRKQDIIDAAIKEFGEFSYDTASVNRIISASGTSKGTFYHYFRDKKDLYCSIIEDSIRIKQQYMAQMMADVKARNDFFDVMKVQVKATAQFMRDMPDLYRFGAMFARETSAIKDEISARYIPQVGDSFQKIVEAGVAEGMFTDRYPPSFVVRIIRHLMLTYYDALFDKDEAPTIEAIEERLDMLFDFIRRGLQSP